MTSSPKRRPTSKSHSVRVARSRKRAPLRKIRLETILVPIDFSSASLYPIRWAQFFAQRAKASLQQKMGADLIVTATHGRSGLPHVMMGSTAEEIIRYAKSPVLVVPSRATRRKPVARKGKRL